MSYRTASPSQFGGYEPQDRSIASSSQQATSSQSFGSYSADPATLSQLPITTLRKNARDVERRLGDAIDACSTSMESSPFDVVQRQIRDAQTLLDQLLDLNKAISKVSTESNLDPSQSGTQYHNDKLRYFTQSFRRMKQAWDEKREREELFNHAAHPKESDGENGETSVAMRTMMADSSSLQNSNRNMSAMMDQGEEVKQLLIKGRKALANATNSIQTTMAAFTSIDGAMRLIQRAKFKQTVILGVVIGLCVCVFLWMMM